MLPSNAAESALRLTDISVRLLIPPTGSKVRCVIRYRPPILIPLIVCGLHLGCGAIHSETAHVADSTAVHDLAVGIIAADNDKDLERVLAYYAPDAVLMPPSAAPVEGRGRIRPRYESLFGQFRPAIEGEIDEIVVSGEFGYVRGRNGGWLRGLGGVSDRSLNDLYLMIVRRGDTGRWHITRLIWHPGTVISQ